MPSLSRRLATSTPAIRGSTLTLSNMTATLQSDNSTVDVNVDCTPDIVNVTLTENGTKVAPDTTPSGGVASWTVTGLSAGSHTLTAVGYNVPSGQSGGQSTPPIAASVTIPASSGLLWEPDYSSESNSVASGTPSSVSGINPGLAAGITWDSFQPPAVRGVPQSSRAAICTGADIPGASQTFTPSGCIHWQIQPGHTSNDFCIPALTAEPSASPGDGQVWMRLSDVQVGAGAIGDGLAYPTGPAPENNSITAKLGDSMTNQSNVSASNNENVRVGGKVNNGVIDYSTTQQITYTGPTLTPGSSYTNAKGNTFTYNGQTITQGTTYTAVEVPIIRAQESTEGPISPGDVFIVATGDINREAGFSSRTECYARFPTAGQGGGTTPAPNWPDPVFSERWYSNNFYLDPSMDTIDGQNWWEVQQFKGQNGGSPPMELAVHWGSTQGKGTWAIDDTNGQHPTPNLGPATLGQWYRFVIGVGWDWRTPANGGQGWLTIYMNPTESDPTQATPTYQNMGCTTMDSFVQGFSGTLTNGSNQVTNATISGAYVGATVSVKKVASGQTQVIPLTALPANTAITAISGNTLTLSNPATLTGSATGSLNMTGADPIYFKNGIYRSISWQTTHNVYSGIPKVGETIQDVWSM